MKKNISRFIAAFLAAAMSTGCVTAMPERGPGGVLQVFTASAEDLVEGDFAYAENSTGVTVTKYTGDAEKVTIPSTLGGLPVTAIGSNAFYNNGTIKSVKMPETVTTIGSSAFKLCSGLSDIKLHEGITSIGSEAFNNIAVTEITIPATLTSCEKQFYNCEALKKVTFADGITTIPEGCLKDAYGVKTVVIPKTVTAIGANAFYGCRNLKDFTFHEGITSIGYLAFHLTGLEEITLPSTLTYCNKAFDGSALKKVTFAEGIEKIPDDTMYSVDSLETVVLPDTVKTIGEDAFNYCKSLASIELPEGIETLGNVAFAHTAIEEITIPSTVTGCRAFYESDVKKVIFAEGMETIPYHCMHSANNLEEAVLPDSVKKIDSEAFIYCSSLKKINLPEGLESIGSEAFYRCSSLRNIIFPESLTSISGYAFRDAGLTEVTIPVNLTSINKAFASCSALRKAVFADGTVTIPDGALSGAEGLSEVVLPDSVKTINSEAFYNTPMLKSITLPEKLEVIGGRAFEKGGLRSLVVPDSVTEIKNFAFQSCTRLKAAVIGKGVTVIGQNAFNGNTSLEKIVLPDHALNLNTTFVGCSKLNEIIFSDEAFAGSSLYNVCHSCYSLKDPRFTKLNYPGSSITAEKTSLTSGSRVKFTVSFDAVEGFADAGTDRIISINTPYWLEVDKESVEILSGTPAGDHDFGGGMLSYFEVPFSSDTGSISFYGTVTENSNFNVSADLKMTSKGNNTRKAPIGITGFSVSAVEINVPGTSDSLSPIICGKGPKGVPVDIYMNGKLAASPVTDKITGQYSAKIDLPKDTKEGTEFAFYAQYDDVKTEEYTLTYSKSEPVIRNIKLCVSPAEGDVDVTSAFTGLDTPVVRTRRDKDMRFTLDITNSDKIGKVIMVGKYGGVRATIPAVYDEESGLWIAEGNYKTVIADELSDFNVLIVSKEDVENGVAVNYSDTYYSHPSGIIFSYGYNGIVYDKDTSNPITGAELTLVGIDKDGKEYTCDMTQYGQKAHTYSDEQGEYAWIIPYGDWKIVCTAEGYEPTESRWFTIPQDTSVYSFDLSKPHQEEPPMIVTSPPATEKPAVTTTEAAPSTDAPTTTTNNTSTTAVPTTTKKPVTTTVPTTTKNIVTTTVPVTASASADGGFSEKEIMASPVKPVAEFSKLVLSPEQAGETVEINLFLSGANKEYSNLALHFRMDDRLQPVVDKNSGMLAISKGAALVDCPALTSGTYAKPDKGWNEYYLMCVDMENNGLDGPIATITVTIPENAKHGDVYPLDILYRPGDAFTSIVSDAEKAKLMQAYFFTKGINNEEYNRNFMAPPKDIIMAGNLANIPFYCDGYIAIEDIGSNNTTEASTTATKPVTTTTAAKPTTTTAKPATTTAKPTTTTAIPAATLTETPATGSTTVSETVTTVVITEPPTELPTEPVVTGIIPDGKFRDGINNWSFSNSGSNFKEFSDDYFLTDEDRTKLLNGLAPHEKRFLIKEMYDKWGGSCYGMSAASIVSCYGLLDPSVYQTGAATVYDIQRPPTRDVVSLINYYYLIQFTDPIIDITNYALRHQNEAEKAALLLDKAEKGENILIGFFYKYRGSDGKLYNGGHAIVGYGVEDVNYPYNGKVYNKRINTYDCNCIDFNPRACVYIDTTDYSWAIPRYDGCESAVGARLDYCPTEREFINYHGLLGSDAAPEKNNRMAHLSMRSADPEQTVQKINLNSDGTYTICPEEEQTVVSYGDREEGEEEGDQDLNFILDDPDKAYLIKLGDASAVDLSMVTGSELLDITFGSAQEIIIDPSGMVRAVGSKSDFNIAMVSDDDAAVTDWNTIEVTGDAAQVEFRKTENGYILSGDDLTDVKVNAEGKTYEPERSFSTEKETVLIHEITEDKIGISIDEDENGTFETPLDDAAETMLGDTNCDSIVDANDASEILSLYAQISTGGNVSDETKAIGDVNKDGLLDSTDASLILEYYALASTSEGVKAEDFFKEREAD